MASVGNGGALDRLWLTRRSGEGHTKPEWRCRIRGWGRGQTGELASHALCRVHVMLSGTEKLACIECARVAKRCFHLTQFTAGPLPWQKGFQ